MTVQRAGQDTVELAAMQRQAVVQVVSWKKHQIDDVMQEGHGVLPANVQVVVRPQLSTAWPHDPFTTDRMQRQGSFWLLS